MSANGLTRLLYIGCTPVLQEQLDRLRGPAEWILPLFLPPRTTRRLSGRRMGYLPPRWFCVID